MKKAQSLVALLLAASLVCSGCNSQQNTPEQEPAPAPVETQPAQEEKPAEESKPAEENKADDSKVASPSEMSTVVDVVEEGMEPIAGDKVKDGVYGAAVNSSSNMFKITDCQLTVEGGQMSAVLTMGGTGYAKLFMGSSEEAVEAAEEQFILPVANEKGEDTFTIPVEALDAGLPVSAFSKKKEKWYDRTLLVRADSLPPEAFQEGLVTDPASLNLSDGFYSVSVLLEGGSGKASVQSPAQLKVEGGVCTATIVWSSKNYDYMKVDEERFDVLSTEGGSTFEIPVSGFDWKLPVIADTVAMGTPHEVAYTLTFDSASIQPLQ